MKPAACRQFSASQILSMMVALFVFFSLLTSSTSFTPPKIIYGGWTPILPGHPFFFAGKRHYQQYQVQSKPHYSQISSQYTHHSYSPNVHNTVDQHVQYGNYGHHEPHSEIYHSQSVNYHNHPREPRINSNGQKSKKNIFAYYPPQSSYDNPNPNENLDYKPVYLEVPRKPFELFENPHKAVPYILPSLKELFPKGLKISDQGKDQTYLKIAPIGKVNPHSIYPIGHISLGNLQYIPNLHPKTEYKSGHASTIPVHLRNQEKAIYLPESHPQSSRHQTKYNSLNINHNSEPHGIPDIINNFRGTDFPYHRGIQNQGISDNSKPNEYVNYQPLHDVSSSKSGGATSYYLEDPNYRNKALIVDSSLQGHGKTYPTTSEVYHDTKYVPSEDIHSDKPKELILPSTGEGISNNDIKLLGTKVGSYNPSKHYYVLNSQKPVLSPGSYHFDQYPKMYPKAISYKGAKHSLVPKLLETYIPRNSKVKTLYQKPSILTHIRGTPAIVEREVAIIHVPVDESEHSPDGTQSYSENSEILFSSASTPRTVEFRNFYHGNDSKQFHPQNEHNSPFVLNKTLTNHIHKHHEDPEVVSKEDDECIFVGTRGLIRDDDSSSSENDASDSSKESAKKQFFHAYYAPSDHVPPKGYVKMTVHEFKKLFKNAEIQYIKRDQGELFRSLHKSSK
ncbi:uncharacterized protein LOC129971125 [Argiope bruennichi]|uniref:uncharacterized protein LOC129971125 n=1 Tax=Argiope bruennichi TaxID=94029 RepID=UPI002495501B|nr:uncharacterized protein LOC129971125 [Argiope bruennichi]